jgi:diphosphomevalonate decarboxylase
MEISFARRSSIENPSFEAYLIGRLKKAARMWSGEAPSNIALIKYMGKLEGNVPRNVSLSYALDRFSTKVCLENCLEKDRFVNEIGLDEKSIDRFLRHLQNIKKLYDYNGFFRVKSFNNFPHSAGIASSSSSFAALTKCALTAICEIKNAPIPSVEEMSAISRQASGASCRSFFSPWCVWDRDGARNIDIKIGELDHDLVLVDKSPKKISSSEAHKLVESSPLFKERPSRAEKRLSDSVDALNNDRWNDACKICWEEFLDMHRLFETSTPSFGYIQSKTKIVLDEVEKFYKTNGDGPIATIDAGPNVHFLWRKNQNESRKKLKETILSRDNTIEFL